MNITQRIDIDEVINTRAKFHLWYIQLCYGLRYGEYYESHLQHDRAELTKRGHKLRQWIAFVHTYEALGIQYRSRNIMRGPLGAPKSGGSLQLYRDRAHFIRELVCKWRTQKELDQ